MQVVFMLHSCLLEQRQRDFRRNYASDFNTFLAKFCFGIAQEPCQPLPIVNSSLNPICLHTIGPKSCDRMLYRLAENPIEPSAHITGYVDRIASGFRYLLRSL